MYQGLAKLLVDAQTAIITEDGNALADLLRLTVGRAADGYRLAPSAISAYIQLRAHVNNTRQMHLDYLIPDAKDINDAWVDGIVSQNFYFNAQNSWSEVLGETLKRMFFVGNMIAAATQQSARQLESYNEECVLPWKNTDWNRLSDNQERLLRFASGHDHHSLPHSSKILKCILSF